MKPALFILLLTMVSVIAFVVPRAAGAQNDPRIGVWKINLEKSKYNPGPPPRSQTRTFEAQGRDVKVRVAGIAADGSRVAYGYTANYDGKDYPISGSGIPGGAETIAFRRNDAYTFDAILKKAGKIVITNHLVVSKDGKVLTMKTAPVKDLVIFDRE
jgi:hypothetical protein